MNMLGKVDVDELEAIKKTLRGCGYKVTDDALAMIEELENLIVTMTLNHRSYCERTAEYINKLNEKILEDSWTRNPDRSGGQFTQEEIDRSARGGEGW